MYKVGIIGDRDSILGFKALGLDVFPCSQEEEGRRLLNKIVKEEYAIIYITEGLASKLVEEINEYKNSKLPAIIPIPNKDGASGTGMDSVRNAVERAVGADILFGGEN